MEGMYALAEGTRHCIQPVGSIDYSSGQTKSIELDNVGWVSRVLVNFRGTINAGMSSAFTDLGPWNLCNRIRAYVNLNNFVFVDISGYNLYISNSIRNFGARMDAAGIGNTTPHADEYAAGVSNGNNVWSLWYEIPFSINVNTYFDMGGLIAQAREVNCKIEINWSPITDVITVNGTGVAVGATAYVYVDYFTLPPPGANVVLPPDLLFKTTDERKTNCVTGDNRYRIEQQGDLLRLGQVVSLNGARSDAIDEFRFEVNRNQIFEKKDRQLVRFFNRELYGLKALTGVFYHDFMAADGLVKKGFSANPWRDVIDTDEAAQVELVTKITNGTTIGSSPYIDYILERLDAAV